MTHVRLLTVAALIGLTVSLVPLAARAGDPAVKCEASKLKEAGKYGNCRLKADSKGVKKGEAADYTKCVDKFTDKWGKVETKAGPTVCPSEADVGSMGTRITTDAAEVAIQLSGVRYADTGLGSVIDHQTGLEWQKTDDAGGLTDKDKSYTWSAGGGGFTEPDGTAFTDFLYGLNGGTNGSGSGPTTGCYADHCDWRIPLIEELTTILLEPFPCGTNPCIDQSVFGAINASSFYWSASTNGNDPDVAWGVYFLSGNTLNDDKFRDDQVRAVRGGS